MTARRTTAAVLAVLALAAALAACGRRNPPRPPDDRKAAYTYPRSYPAPATVLPAAGEAGAAAESEPPQEEEIRKLSPIPSPTSRTRTTTYGPASR